MSYIGTEPKDIRSFGRTKFDYTASQGQTAFTGADDDGKVLAFTVGQIEVYVNGILMDDSDFTTTGTGTVTLASAANLNDVVNIVSFESNIPDNDYVPASGGTFTGNVTHSGTVTNSGAVTNSSTTTMTGALTGTSAGFTGDVNIGNNASSNPLSKLRLGGTQYGAADIRPTDEGGHKVGMAFYTDGTGDTTIDPVLRMTLDSSGALLIGATSIPSSGSGGSAFKVDSNGRRNLFMSTSSSNNQGHIVFNNPNGQVGYIGTNGSATTYHTSSDYRLKENVTNISDGITRLKKLSPKRFNFIADADTTVDGFLAHEAQIVVPEAIGGTKDEVDDDGNPVMQNIDHSKLVPLLTAALQEAIAKIETLETKVAELEAE